MTDDRERAWTAIGRHGVYQTDTYASWGAAGTPAQSQTDVAAQARRSWDIGSPEEVAEVIRRCHARMLFTQ